MIGLLLTATGLSAQSFSQLVLVDAGSNQDIRALGNGGVINLATDGTALATPLFVVLSQEGGSRLSSLIGFVVASAVTTSTSSFLWGKLADRASHLAMAIGGSIAGLAGLLAILMKLGGNFSESICLTHFRLLLLVFLAQKRA